MAPVRPNEPPPPSEWSFSILTAAAPGVDAALDQIEAADSRLVSHMTWAAETGGTAHLLMSRGPLDGMALLQRLSMFRLPVERFQVQPLPSEEECWQHIGDDLTMLTGLLDGEAAARQISAERRAARRAA